MNFLLKSKNLEERWGSLQEGGMSGLMIYKSSKILTLISSGAIKERKNTVVMLSLFLILPGMLRICCHNSWGENLSLCSLCLLKDIFAGLLFKTVSSSLFCLLGFSSPTHLHLPCLFLLSETLSWKCQRIAHWRVHLEQKPNPKHATVTAGRAGTELHMTATKRIIFTATKPSVNPPPVCLLHIFWQGL